MSQEFFLEEPLKKLALLLFVAILLAACQPAATPQPTAVPPTEPPTSTAIPPTPTTDPLVEQIAGRYLTTITREESATSPGIDEGDYALKLQPDLRWFITDANDPGWVGAQGYYTVTSDQIVFKVTGGAMAGECIGKSGTYQWSLVGQTLTFTLVSDYCSGNKFLLPLHPLVKHP
jgi:hypothetical protein